MPTRTVAVTGSTGLIGEALVRSLRSDGQRVVRLVRDPASAGHDDVVWDPGTGRIDTEGLEGVDAVVHLAGEPIGGSRWTSETRREIRESRVRGTRTLAAALAGLDDPPEVLVSASAVGIYGRSRGDEVLDESATLGDDFVAEVCVAWEHAAEPAREAGIRVVHPRTGVIVADGGPLIEKVELPFKLGMGGRVGDGWQYVAWMSLTDEVRALRFLLDHDLDGPVNLTAPTPVTNRTFTTALGKVLRRPTLLPIPPVALRLVYGEMGVTLATSSQRAVPRRLLDAGFTFTLPDLEAALRVAFDRGSSRT